MASSLKMYLLFAFLGIANWAAAQAKSWQKFGMDNTQLYFFRLPNGVDNSSFTATVTNEKIKSLPTQMYFNGKAIKRKTEFVYLAEKTNVFYGQKLPFYLPANVWVFAFNYSDAFLLVDDALKIRISQKKKAGKSKWQLPASFDMRSDQAISLKQLKSKSTEEIVARYASILSLEEKQNVVSTVPDTTLVFSLNKLPKGMTLICKGINLRDHANQEFVIDNASLYKKEFFFYLPTGDVEVIANKADQCRGKMTDINGNIGYAGGCITGMGSGKCAGILKPNASKKYRVTLIIETN